MSYSERFSDVVAAQHALNMSPRNDSRLTHMYAARELDERIDAAQVARELLATEFIYRTTLYGEVIEAFMRRVAEYVRATYDLAWKDTWVIVKFYAPIALKLMMLSATRQHIPDRLGDADPGGPS